MGVRNGLSKTKSKPGGHWNQIEIIFDFTHYINHIMESE